MYTEKLAEISQLIAKKEQHINYIRNLEKNN